MTCMSRLTASCVTWKIWIWCGNVAWCMQEELMNRIAQEQNARMYVLSIVAAIFLPISFVTGLFGMNVAGLPGY